MSDNSEASSCATSVVAAIRYEPESQTCFQTRPKANNSSRRSAILGAWFEKQIPPFAAALSCKKRRIAP
jgi:hypothetical protein